jgi:hypothetical protein
MNSDMIPKSVKKIPTKMKKKFEKNEWKWFFCSALEHLLSKWFGKWTVLDRRRFPVPGVHCGEW